MDYLKHNIWILVLSAIVFSFIFPAVGILLFSRILTPMLMILMFISTLDIDLKKVMSDIRRPGKTLITLAIVHLASPFVILSLQRFFEPDVFLGLVIAATVSSGVSVVFLTDIFGGEPSRSLVVTTISNLMSPLLVPLLVLIFARTNIEIDALNMAWKITQMIVIPFIAAQFVSRTKAKKKIDTYKTEFSLLLLFLLTIGIVSPVRELILNNLLLSLQLGAVITALTALNFFLGFSLGKKLETKISYGVTASFKNFTLATVIALTLFNSSVALPAIIYTVVNSLFLIPMQWFIEGQAMQRHDIEG